MSKVAGSSDTFEFVSYTIDTEGAIILVYRCGTHEFRELITLPSSNLNNLSSPALNHALQILHLIAGVSYFKPFITTVQSMHVHYSVPREVLDFAHTVYEKGLGELLFKNNLPPTLPLNFTCKEELLSHPLTEDAKINTKVLLGLGGGKDSLVAVELLKQLSIPVATFGVNGHDILTQQAHSLQTMHLPISRKVDTDALNVLRTDDASPVVNGHVPISAILTAIGLVSAVTSQISDIVVAVERSANEPTIKNYQGHDINHQWSKSSEYEKGFDSVIRSYVHPSMRFYSLLRPLRELDIMRLYFQFGLADTFKTLASSCNLSMAWTAGREDAQKLWDGTCDKCCFMYLLMSGAGHNQYAQEIMGSDLFADASHDHTFNSLLGLTDSKPFDCVGEIDEARESMDKAKLQIASAQKFTYPEAQPSVLWSDTHQIPSAYVNQLKQLIESTLLRQ